MKLYNLALALILTTSSAFATSVTIPNSFSSGTATNAAQMNANFTAVKAAVDDNDSRISALEGSVASQFMGFSSSTAIGNAGFLGMGNLCHTTFSGSHMCSTTEFATARMNGVTVSGNAWITPISKIGENTLANSNDSCMGWNTNNGAVWGAIINSNGGIYRSACSTSNYVACCK